MTVADGQIGTEVREPKQHYPYPKILYVGDEELQGIMLDRVVVQEKIDGANFQFQLFNDKLIFGSRGTKIDEKNGQFAKQIAYVKDLYEKNPPAFSPQMVYFAEAMIKHTLVYDYDKNPPLIGLDVMDKQTEHYLKWPHAKNMFENIGAAYVAIVAEYQPGQLKAEILQDLLKNWKSWYGPEAEGVVIKNYDRLSIYARPLFGKVVQDTFKERSKLAFAGLKEFRDTERLVVEEFVTPARIQKAINRLTVEHGKPLNMKLMPDLFPMVTADVLTEEIVHISKKYDDLNFPSLTKLVACECAKHLKRLLTVGVL